MPNHIHLLLRTGLVPISNVMRRILTGYAVTFNRRLKKRAWQSRKWYREFVQQGIEQGRRPERLGEVWCAAWGGWKAIKTLRGVGARIRGGERILGDGDFVETVLWASSENLERRATRSPEIGLERDDACRNPSHS